MAGHTLDPKTIVLYKHQETQASTAYAGPVVDLAGNYDLTPQGDPVPSVTWGPAGNTPDVYARAFSDTSSTDQYLDGGTVDQDLNDANRAAHTWEALFYLDTIAADSYLFGVGGPIGAATANDWLMRLAVLSTGEIQIFWENQDDEQSGTTSGAGIGAGTWHVIHVTRDEDPLDSSVYESKVYLDGVLVDTFNNTIGYTIGDGLIPESTSGLSGSITVGNGGDTTLDHLIGQIGSLRMVTEVMADPEIAAAATTLLADGTIAFEPARTLIHWSLDDSPDWVDESPLGLHAEFVGGRYLGSDSKLILDLVRDGVAGGRAQSIEGNEIVIDPGINGSLIADTLSQSLVETFSDTTALPAWTAMSWILFPEGGVDGDYDFLAWDGSAGETLADNVLARVGIDSSYLTRSFHERAAGTDVTASGGELVAEGDRPVVHHWAVRVREDPGSAGNIQIQSFIDGVLVDTLGPLQPPQGGTSNDNRLRFFAGAGGFDGWIQDFTLIARDLSDAEILSAAESIGIDGGLNLGFEIEDPDLPGFADSWVVSSSAATEYAAYGSTPPGSSVETFEVEWGVIPLFAFGVGDLEQAIYTPNTTEDFENGWGDNVLVLGALEAATYDAENVEDFEESWQENQGYKTALIGEGFDLVAAVYEAENVEDFEEGWDDNENYKFEIVNPVLQFSPAIYDQVENVEDFEESIADRIAIIEPTTDVITILAHGLVNLDLVKFRNVDGRLPSGLPSNVLLRVRNATANTFQLSATTVSPTIDIVDYGFGTHFMSVDPNKFWTTVITSV